MQLLYVYHARLFAAAARLFAAAAARLFATAAARFNNWTALLSYSHERIARESSGTQLRSAQQQEHTYWKYTGSLQNTDTPYTCSCVPLGSALEGLHCNVVRSPGKTHNYGKSWKSECSLLSGFLRLCCDCLKFLWLDAQLYCPDP